jgi:hypothetical protein
MVPPRAEDIPTPEVVYLRMCGRVVVSLAWRWETRAFQQKSSEQCG